MTIYEHIMGNNKKIVFESQGFVGKLQQQQKNTQKYRNIEKREKKKKTFL